MKSILIEHFSLCSLHSLPKLCMYTLAIPWHQVFSPVMMGDQVASEILPKVFLFPVVEETIKSYY